MADEGVPFDALEIGRERRKAMRWWKSKSGRQKLVIAAVVLAIVAIGGVVAAQRMTADEPAQARNTGANRERPEAKPSGKPLKLGTVARISSNYRVAVTELTLYKVATGQLMVVTVKATYIGKEDGEPWGDLTVKYMDPDSQIFGESACPFDLGELDASDQATLKTNQATTYGVCIELPASTVEGGRIYVEEALAREEGSKSWTTEGAVTKTAPAIASDSSGSSGGRDDDTSFHGPGRNSGSADYSKACKKYEDDVEKYRDGRDDLDELAERYEDNPDHDDDKLDEYQEWLDGMDKNAEWFDKNC